MVVCIMLVSGIAYARETIGKIDIVMPNCVAIFTLENVDADYVVLKENGIYSYRFAFPGTDGKATCDSYALSQISYIWADADPSSSDAGGGGSDEPMAPGWTCQYPPNWTSMDGKGLWSVYLNIYPDGTLVQGAQKEAVASITFSFGYQVPVMSGELPEDLISWEWRSESTGGSAGGPSIMTPVDLPKYPVVDLSVTYGGSAPDLTPPAEPPTAPPTPPTSSEIKVLLDGELLAFDVPPQVMGSRTMVPMRAIFEALGATISWDAATQTATGIKGDTEIKLSIGSTSPTVNGEVVSIDQPGVIVDGRTLVPLRFIGESLGVNVSWEDSSRTVIITSE